jgi:Acidic fibroblast growth factor binding (FIBP).
MPIEILAADVLDHYRTYNMFEKLLHYPVKLQTQIAFQLKSEIRNFLIEKYYDLDDSVVREFLGNKVIFSRGLIEVTVTAQVFPKTKREGRQDRRKPAVLISSV